MDESLRVIISIKSKLSKIRITKEKIINLGGDVEPKYTERVRQKLCMDFLTYKKSLEEDIYIDVDC